MAATKSQPNLLEGKLFPKVLTVAVPLMLANVLHMLFNAADMVIVGLSGVEGALGAIGTTGALTTLIINVVMGCSIGANVVVSKCIGAGERGKTQQAVHTALCAAVLFGLFSCIVGQIVCRPLLILLGDEGHILEMAELYTRIYFAGAPFLSVTNFCKALFRAKGDTKTPLKVISISGLINVGLNLFFVLVLDMDVDGVAIATMLSYVYSSVVLVYKLMKDDSWCRLQLRKLRIHGRMLWDIVYVGIPSALQGALFAVSNMIIQSSIVQLNNAMYPGGSAIIDGNAAASNVEGFAYTITNAVQHTAVTFVSQHYGAGKYKRIGAVRRNCYLIAFLAAVLSSGIIIIFQRPLIGLYVRDEAAISAAAVRNSIMLTTYFVISFMEVGSGVLRGLGKSLTSTTISLLGACVFRVIWIYTIFKASPTLECIYLSYPISWLLTSAAQFIVGQVICKKLVKKEVSQL